MKNKNILVIKLGGALIENDSSLNALFDGLIGFLKNNNRPIVLVHGGGCLVDDLLKGLGLKSEKKKGFRVTPIDQIQYITGALAGTANKLMLAKSIQYGISSVGLCLSDDHLCEIKQLDPELGSVGDASPGSPKLLNLLLDNGYMPIISSIGITDNGELMNINADQAATSIAMMLNADLAFLSDVDGILDKDGKLIHSMNEIESAKLIENGVISGGMEVKVKAALKASKTLNKTISVAGWKNPQLLSDLLAGKNIGTQVLAE